MSDPNAAESLLAGVWKLEVFEHALDGTIYQYSDILMFSSRYYSDFQADRSDEGSIRCHMGIYKTSHSTITFQIQLSNDPKAIGSSATGIFSIEDGILKITFDHGAMPGTWVYNRLSD
ncbi:hypothetical protein JXA40_00865 [bacterium]|nr:hypothetical protein [candidate division CSSED10-310 bacterium]